MVAAGQLNICHFRSYENSQRATEDGTLGREIVPVSVPQKKGKPDIVVKQDEEFSRYNSVHISEKRQPLYNGQNRLAQCVHDSTVCVSVLIMSKPW